MADTPPKTQISPGVAYSSTDDTFVNFYRGNANKSDNSFAIVGQTASGKPIAAYGIGKDSTALVIVDSIYDDKIPHNDTFYIQQQPYLRNAKIFNERLTTEGDHINPADEGKVRKMLDEYMPNRDKSFDFKNQPLQKGNGETFLIITYGGAPAKPTPSKQAGQQPVAQQPSQKTSEMPPKPKMPLKNQNRAFAVEVLKYADGSTDGERDGKISEKELRPFLKGVSSDFEDALKKSFNLPLSAAPATVANAINDELVRAQIRHTIAETVLRGADNNRDGKINETESGKLDEKELSDFFKRNSDGPKARDIIRSFGMAHDSTNAEMAGAINNELQLIAPSVPLSAQNKNGKIRTPSSRKK